MVETVSTDKVRIDKWLWAARFFKTRSQAAQAVGGGRVQVNGARVKPARLVQAGEELRIRRGEVEFVVTVLGVAAKRRPAKEAQMLYEENGESIAAREQAREQRRVEAMGRPQLPRRPTKRERRQIVSFIGKKGNY
jgi:ribosome-associated heat shock protein Hsp15